MEREVIQIAHLIAGNEEDILSPDDLSEIGFELIDEEIVYANLEDDVLTTRYILKRLVDNKYFEMVVIDDGYGETDFEVGCLTEVFPVEKTIIVYE